MDSGAEVIVGRIGENGGFQTSAVDDTEIARGVLDILARGVQYHRQPTEVARIGLIADVYGKHAQSPRK